MNNELLPFIPYSFLTSVYAPIPALLALKFGWGAKGVGIASAISTIFNFLASLFWPKYIKMADRKRTLILGYLGMFTATILITSKKSFYIAAAMMSFFNSAPYYVAFSTIREKFQSISYGMKKFNTQDRIFSLLGFLTGALMSWSLPPEDVAFAVSALALLSLLFIGSVTGEEGMLGVVEGGIEELEEVERLLPSLSISFPFFRSQMPFLLTAFIFSINSGMIYPQLPTVVKTITGKDMYVYFFLVLNNLAQLIFYNRFPEIGETKTLVTGVAIRTLAFSILIAAVSRESSTLLPVFYVLSGISWTFLNMFFSVTGLKVDEELVGATSAVKSTAYAIGSLFGGYLIDSFGFTLTFSLALIAFLIFPLPYLTANTKLRNYF